ncbi:uncharacterized protein LOC143254308 isoform X2 [Tachypleus tridentatus]|uniref:uncharacterized protein LOC143254308 isoform X2 n=1 Tax=Tachypleus tridentatus TaxID=6853 RepID=UPI003FD24726
MDTVRKQIRGKSTSPEPRRESRLTSIIDQLLSNKTKDKHLTEVYNKRSEKLRENLYENQPHSPASDNNDSDGQHHQKTTVDKPSVICTKNNFDIVVETTQPDRQPPVNRESPTSTGKFPASSPSNDTSQTQTYDQQGSSRGAQLGNGTNKAEGICPPGTDYKAPPGGGQRQLEAPSFGYSLSATSRANDMPTDTLPASAISLESVPFPLKPERLSPEFESSSPSVSPHSPNPARAFPSTVGLGFGLRAAPFPPSSTGLERYTSSGLVCGASALKQMEMMTRNYSEFMRSLAAKYNNQNSRESFSFVQPNGTARPFEGHLSYKSGTPPLLGRSLELPENSNLKVENHLKSSPILGESRSVPFSFGDFSSSQTLLNLVRTASAKSTSQLENYLRGANKRPFESENKSDPLDLTMGATKRPRLGTPDTSPHHCLYLPISRDIRDIIGSIKTDTETLRNNYSDTKSKDSFRKTSSWTNLLEGRLLRSENSSAQASPKSSDRGRCPSFCTDQSCLNISDASEIAQWTVDDVVKFVMSVESCAEYADFRVLASFTLF